MSWRTDRSSCATSKRARSGRWRGRTSPASSSERRGATATADTGPSAGIPGQLQALVSDPEAWDRFVAACPTPAYLQTAVWARVKRANGWRAVRLAVETPAGTLGAQVLVRRAGPLPWSLGYVPRGPIGVPLDRPALTTFTGRLRAVARDQRIASVLCEPELDADEGAESWLRDLGWRPRPHLQPDSTRIVDLTLPEEQLWDELRGKWRQYVNKARRSGVAIVEGDASDLTEAHAVYAEAQRRAGVIPRAESSFREMWTELAPRGMTRLWVARAPGTGEVQATILAVSCGSRMTELYGGATDAGNAARANYLLKWEAIRRSREAGFALYDMWGLPHAGIAHFKAGFGGREVQYVGAWELVVDRVGHAAIRAGIAARARYVALRYGGRSGGAVPED